MRILVISKEAWRDDQSGGNVLSNIFRSFDAEFAQIYCNELMPYNDVCEHYFQITDRDMLNSIRNGMPAGKAFDYTRSEDTFQSGIESFSNLKVIFGGLLRIMREIVWSFGKWDNKGIESFVKDFKPDIIFAPCYGVNYMHKLTTLVHNIAGVNVISYISDDFYSNRQLHWAPWYWIHHFILRKNTRSIFKRYSLVYTMTDEQKESCEKAFASNMRILRKAAVCDVDKYTQPPHRPIRFIYAGGIYLNRWKTLGIIASAMRRLNMDGIKFKLDIYTNNPLTAAMRKAINDGTTATVHPAVSSKELQSLYSESDIALHCESFDIVNRLTVRLSFSTKIVDCLESGCAVMAVCDHKQAGFAYLKRNNCAICISSKNEIEGVLLELYRNPNIISDYKARAMNIAQTNHNPDNIKKQLTEDFNVYGKN